MASKRGPLSKAETFYIQEHVKLGKDINEIASDLDRPVKSIEKCVIKATKENTPKPLTAGDQFAKNRGAVIMTENASTLGDAKRKTTLTRKTSNCITQIKHDK